MEKAKEATPLTTWGHYCVLTARDLSTIANQLDTQHFNLSRYTPSGADKQPYSDLIRHLHISELYLRRAADALDKLGYTHLPNNLNPFEVVRKGGSNALGT